MLINAKGIPRNGNEMLTQIRAPLPMPSCTDSSGVLTDNLQIAISPRGENYFGMKIDVKIKAIRS